MSDMFLIDDLLSVSEESHGIEDISMEMLLYPVFFRKHGLRKLMQLNNPVISSFSKGFELPRGSIFHFNPEKIFELGPDPSLPVLKNTRGIKYIRHATIFPFENHIGNIVKRPTTPVMLIQRYRLMHRTMKTVNQFKPVDKNHQFLLVVNYNLLNQVYKYRPHRFVNYYHFYNFYKSIITVIDILTKQSDRQQFLELRLPAIIVNRTLLNQLTDEFIRNDGPSTRYMKFFKTDDDFLFHQLWMWLGTNESRQKSIFNLINPLYLNKVNLIVEDGDHYVIVNLGELNYWRDPSADDIEVDEEVEDDFAEKTEKRNTNALSPKRLQYYFYNFIQKVLAVREKTVKLNETYSDAKNDYEDVEDEDIEYTGIVSEPSSDEEVTIPSSEPKTPDKSITPPETTKPKNGVTSLPTDDEIRRFDEPDTVEDDVPQDTGEIVENEPPPLEIRTPSGILKTTMDDKGNTVNTIVKSYPEHVQYVMDEAKTKLKDGVITAKQFKKVEEAVKRYQTSPSPYHPDKTIAQDLEINVEETINIPKREVPDNDWVVDKSMLTTSIESNKAYYIKNIMAKDIIRSVMTIQKAGMVVSGIRREVVKDPVTEYEMLHVDVQPINGSPTTVRIKLPSFNPKDGTFKSLGSVYTLRSQRNEKPIRKVNPVKVSLTSYYGKLSVTKTDKKAYNMEKWIHNQIQNLSFSGEIKELHYGNTLNTETLLPVIYCMVSKRFSSLRLTKRLGDDADIFMNFDYDKRWMLYLNDVKQQEAILNLDEEARQKQIQSILAKYDTAFHNQGYIVFARDNLNKRRYFLKVDNNLVYSDTEINQPDKGITLPQFLGLINTPPSEYAEIKIFSKSIPIGLLLGYYIGLTPLCRLLNVKPRKVYRGGRYDIQPDEYAIKFSDEVWIFSKRHYQAELILSGFNQYKRYLQDYAVNQFEHSDVYIAILRDAGITMQMENEFKLLLQLFIDDITKTLLLEMKEPTEFIPLLLRAVELLTDMRSRPEVNMDDMVIRGHQRVAGHIYTTLVRNIKQHVNRRGAGRERFDINPNEVFEMIRNDPATTLVDDVNPIQNLKEHENVTFGGEGGRTDRSMVGRTRAFDKTDRGVISEATVDSQKVGITTFLSANPNINSVYGTKGASNEVKPANMLSTSALLAPGATTDDQLTKGCKNKNNTFGSSTAVMR